MKALQARELSSELRTKLFNSGCLRGSLVQAHSFSLLTPLDTPCRPVSLVADLEKAQQ